MVQGPWTHSLDILDLGLVTQEQGEESLPAQQQGTKEPGVRAGQVPSARRGSGCVVQPRAQQHQQPQGPMGLAMG